MVRVNVINSRAWDCTSSSFFWWGRGEGACTSIDADVLWVYMFLVASQIFFHVFNMQEEMSSRKENGEEGEEEKDYSSVVLMIFFRLPAST